MHYLSIFTTIVAFTFAASAMILAMSGTLVRAGLPDYLYLSEFRGRED